MSESMGFSVAELSADDKAQLAEMFADMHRLNEQMARDQAEIEKLREETKAIKRESNRLAGETQEIRHRLKAMV